MTLKYRDFFTEKFHEECHILINVDKENIFGDTYATYILKRKHDNYLTAMRFLIPDLWHCMITPIHIEVEKSVVRHLMTDMITNKLMMNHSSNREDWFNELNQIFYQYINKDKYDDT